MSKLICKKAIPSFLVLTMFTAFFIPAKAQSDVEITHSKWKARNGAVLTENKGITAIPAETDFHFYLDEAYEIGTLEDPGNATSAINGGTVEFEMKMDLKDGASPSGDWDLVWGLLDQDVNANFWDSASNPQMMAIKVPSVANSHLNIYNLPDGTLPADKHANNSISGIITDGNWHKITLQLAKNQWDSRKGHAKVVVDQGTEDEVVAIHASWWQDSEGERFEAFETAYASGKFSVFSRGSYSLQLRPAGYVEPQDPGHGYEYDFANMSEPNSAINVLGTIQRQEWLDKADFPLNPSVPEGAVRFDSGRNHAWLNKLMAIGTLAENGEITGGALGFDVKFTLASERSPSADWEYTFNMLDQTRTRSFWENNATQIAFEYATATKTFKPFVCLVGLPEGSEFEVTNLLNDSADLADGAFHRVFFQVGIDPEDKSKIHTRVFVAGKVVRADVIELEGYDFTDDFSEGYFSIASRTNYDLDIKGTESDPGPDEPDPPAKTFTSENLSVLNQKIKLDFEKETILVPEGFTVGELLEGIELDEPFSFHVANYGSVVNIRGREISGTRYALNIFDDNSKQVKAFTISVDAGSGSDDGDKGENPDTGDYKAAYSFMLMLLLCSAVCTGLFKKKSIAN